MSNIDIVTLFLQYLKKKMGRIPPLVSFLVIVILLCGLFFSFLHQNKGLPLNSSESSNLQRNMNSNSILEMGSKHENNNQTNNETFIEEEKKKPAHPLQRVIVPEVPNKLTEEVKKIEVNEKSQYVPTPEQNSDSIQNFTPFTRNLVDLLKEKGFDESFGNNLAYQIKENLNQREGYGQEKLLTTIREILDPNSSEEDVYDVYRAVVDALTKTSNNSNLIHPSPGPIDKEAD